MQLLTGAFLTLYYAPTPDHAYESVRFISSTAAGRLVRGLHHYRRQLSRRLSRPAPAARRDPRILQTAARADVAVRARAARPGSRIRADRLSAAVGSARLLGDGRHDQHRTTRARGGRSDCRHPAGRLDDRRADADALVLGARHLPAGAARAAHRRAHRADAAAGELGTGQAEARKAVSRSIPIRPSATRLSSPSFCSRSSRWRGAACRRSKVPPIRPTPTTFPRPEWYFLGLFQLLKYFPGQWEVVGRDRDPWTRRRVPRAAPLDRPRPRARSASQRPLIMIAVMAGVFGV